MKPEFWADMLRHVDETRMIINDRAKLIGEIFMKYRVFSWAMNCTEYSGTVIYKDSVRVCFRCPGSEDSDDWVLLRSEELALEPEEAERMALDGAWAAALRDDMEFNRKREGIPP